MGQGGPTLEGGPAMELAQAGVGFHCLDHQEQQLFLPSVKSFGLFSLTQPIPHFSSQ